MKQIAADMTGQEIHPLLLELGTPVGDPQIGSGHDGIEMGRNIFAGND